MISQRLRKNFQEKAACLFPIKRRRRFKIKITKSKKQLRYAEKDLAEFEGEAHRKEVPPGWLRCQFE